MFRFILIFFPPILKACINGGHGVQRDYIMRNDPPSSLARGCWWCRVFCIRFEGQSKQVGLRRKKDWVWEREHPGTSIGAVNYGPMFRPGPIAWYKDCVAYIAGVGQGLINA